LQYDPTSTLPDAFISILSSESGALAAINASPIRYRIINEASAPITAEQQATNQANDAAETSNSGNPPSETALPTVAEPTAETIFELRVSPSTHAHAASIASSPLYSSFTPVSPHRSAIAADLDNRIPDSITKPGLLDWATDSARVGPNRTFREEEKTQWGRSAGVGSEDTKPWRIRDRERKQREEGVHWVMRDLASRGEKKR
jgi:hypothetical protein